MSGQGDGATSFFLHSWTSLFMSVSLVSLPLGSSCGSPKPETVDREFARIIELLPADMKFGSPVYE